MGEFTRDDTPAPEQQKEEPKGFATDVEGVMAHDEVQVGIEKYPVFDVTDQEFHQNMEFGRRRLRFKGDTAAQKYHSGTRYNRPFYIRWESPDGKKYMRKIK